MAEELIISAGSKAEKYQTLLEQVKALTYGEDNLVANLANTSAAIWQTFGHLWVGFYKVESDQLVLGPFQGPIACTRIPKGKGVCGTAWEQGKTLVVEDVNAFPGHIACSSDSLSEIVVPVFNSNGDVVLVLDVDSDQLATFDDVDKEYFEKLAAILSEKV